MDDLVATVPGQQVRQPLRDAGPPLTRPLPSSRHASDLTPLHRYVTGIAPGTGTGHPANKGSEGWGQLFAPPRTYAPPPFITDETGRDLIPLTAAGARRLFNLHTRITRPARAKPRPAPSRPRPACRAGPARPRLADQRHRPFPDRRPVQRRDVVLGQPEHRSDPLALKPQLAQRRWAR